MAVAPLSITDEDVAKDEPLKLFSPSNPTPEETIFLSNIDLAVAFTVETVYFFEVDPAASAAEISRTVERAVAVLLVPYYFLAGRLQVNRESGRLELVCNNAGVLFVNAKTRVTLKELGDLAAPNPSFCHFVHRPGLHRSLPERALFTIQVYDADERIIKLLF
ncbi:putrescine hydroxycinnamoyltransferase 1-like [Momordica charantia]|uniref:Putrescine hydroxycinnamoyltransferase 1-like n=1 Tax=Momordica charantia TaxID=3673 RepID=A0A6J1C8H4_MOMCH|nr:putrescine hydroxycinnamoyltransferase 1-like [Momordica charantia]